MPTPENFEAPKSAEQIKEAPQANLSSYVLERQAPSNQGRDKSDSLVNQGILPSVDFLEMKTGPEATPAQLKDSHVKVEHDKDGTKADYPTGVHAESGSHDMQVNGRNIHTEAIIVSATNGNHFDKKGQIVDSHNRVLAKENEDGSWTIDSGEGFYTQRKDGTIERTSAIRSRDGKDFEVLDTENPLGGMKAPDSPKQSKH